MGFALVSVPKILVKNVCYFAEKRSSHILLKTAQHPLDSVALILSVKEVMCLSLISSSAPFFYIVIGKKPFHLSQVQFLL